MKESVETLVIGAGIAGLAYAHARGSAADVLVVDSSEQPGGLIRTQLVGARGEMHFEHGPEALQSNNEETDRLIEELGLEILQAAPAAKKRYIVVKGDLVALPSHPKEIMGSPLISFAGKLRLFTEPFRDPKIGLDGSLADFAEHRFGREVLDTVIDPFAAGVYAGDARQISVRAAFPMLVEMIEQHGSLIKAMKSRKGGKPPSLCRPRGGMSELPKALANALGNRLALSTSVASISKDARGWRVECNGSTIRAERLVVATPARAASKLLGSSAPEIARELGSVQSESLVSVVHAWRRGQVDHPLDGFGYLVPSREKELQLGTLFSSSIDPSCAPKDVALLRTLIGGARNPRASELADSDLLAVLHSEVAPLLGLDGDPENVWITRYKDTIPRYDLDHPRRIAAIEAELAKEPSLSLVGNHQRGIGVNQLITNSRKLAKAHAS